MKRYYVAAGALLLGTTALAWAADKSADAASADATTVEAKLAWWNALDAKLETAGLNATGSTKTIAAKADMTADSGDPTIAAKLAAASQVGAAAETKLAMADTDAQTGTGGPLEEGGQVTAAELTPRPATMNYPPCDPGPGDDRCIQLYEPGVRAQLAAWNRPTGGLLDHSATTAMGGPYEPIEGDGSAATDLAMNGDGDVDAASGETSETELAHVAASPSVGGPIESQSGYPPCEPGPGDDRCIQLYESGVTGAGN